jgi:trimeric autotransporter adhesin
VMDAMSLQSWTTLSSTTTLPFYKELPSSASSESSTNYSSQTSSLMSGIVGLWHLDETSGISAADSSGNSNGGTMYGGVTLGVAGKMGSAYQFNGSTGYLSLPLITNQTTNITLSAWVYPLAASQNALLFYVGNPGSNGFGIIQTGGSCNNGGKLTVLLGGTNCDAVNSNTNLNINQWNHVVLTRNGSTWQTYLNGVAANTGTSNPSTPTGATSIGGISTGNYFNGLIDEAAAWDRALSSAEVLELYRRGSNRLKYQVRSCPDSTCSTNPAWLGPDGTNQSYFSELYNTTSNILGGTVLAGSPTMTFSNFSGSGLSVSGNRYFQYRTILESDDANSLCNYGSGATACSPELQSVTIGPNHYDTSAPTVISSAAIGHSYQTLSSFVESLAGAGCSAGAKYALSPNGSTYYYWNGTTWSSSSGTYATASPGTDLATNISTFPGVAGTGTLQVMSFLNSTGTTPCQISNLQFGGQSY